MDNSSFCFLVVDAIAPGMKMRRLFGRWLISGGDTPEKERYNTIASSWVCDTRFAHTRPDQPIPHVWLLRQIE